LKSARPLRPGRYSASSSLDCFESYDGFDDILGDLDTGEARLWAAVILTAWRDRRWTYFFDPGSTFPLAAACCGLDVGAMRARIEKEKSRLTRSTDLVI